MFLVVLILSKNCPLKCTFENKIEMFIQRFHMIIIKYFKLFISSRCFVDQESGRAAKNTFPRPR